jgi:para-nitrobenzyl esterase
LIASPLAKDLFHKAIPQSGGLLANMLLSQNLAKAEEAGLNFMKKANTSSISELRKKSAVELQTISNKPDAGRFGITLDGYTLPLNLTDHFKKGLHNQTPVLTGWVTGDGSVLGESKMNLEEYKKEAQTKYGDKTEAFLSVFSATTNEEVKINKQKLSLLGFAGLPAHLLAGYNTKPTYLYQFSHVPPDKAGFPNYGAFHTAEVPYVLHTLHTWKRPWQQLDKDLENTISTYWVNFAKTGNPNGVNLPEWKTYDKQTGNIIQLGDTIENKPALMKKEFDFLEMN